MRTNIIMADMVSLLEVVGIVGFQWSKEPISRSSSSSALWWSRSKEVGGLVAKHLPLGRDQPALGLWEGWPKS